jgi:O-antigen/teichoic acid export membrane protein
MAGSANIRIARNTVVIYVRMVVTILVGLITSRLVLQALGADDVGLYSAVGSTVALISFITGALTATTVRFMNIEMGRPGGDTNRMFNICHVIHIGGALLLLAILETIGLWYIHNHLNVLPGKEADAMFVFQVSTLVACLGIANVPFQSLFTVHERFVTIALVDIVNALVKLGLVIGLLYWKGNGLRMYAVLMSVTTWIAFIVYHWLCRRRWPDIVRWKFVRERKAYKEVLVFNNYNLLSSASMIARSQGSNMLINAFFGTTVNAAFYYAGTVQNYVNQFIANFDMAAAPQITQNIGAGNRERSLALTERVCRICILLFLLLFFPLWSELGFILRAWLGAKMPEGTVLMCRWTLLVAAASATSAGLAQLINAFGRIKWYKIEFSVLYLGCLVAGWLLFRSGYPAYSIIVCFVVADLLSRVIQLILLHFQFGFDLKRFLKEAYLRPAVAALILIGWIFLYRHLPLESNWAKVGGILLTGVVTAVVLFFIGLKPSERKDIRSFLGRKWHEWELDHHHDRVVQREWKKRFGHTIDWNNPKDINEKIQWLMCFSDTSEWTRLSDKVKVRDYVAEKGLGDLLVPMLGTWKRSADIPWDDLPGKFVLKCNHDSGSTHIIDGDTDRRAVGAALDEALKQQYGYRHGEMHYNGIDPCILAEQFLDSGDTVPVDYKVWCFDGKPYCIWACYGRTADHVYVNVYDLDWNPRPEASVFTDHYRDGRAILPKPETLPQMLEAAAKLSEGFPEVRVDFYEVRGKLYFGEMTFASLMGMMDFYTPEFLKELGDQVKLPRL